MKKYLVSIFILATVISLGCSDSNDRTNHHTDSLSGGNTDSSGSQPVQTSPGAANGGNATDTIANRNGDLTPRTDSVIRH